MGGRCTIWGGTCALAGALVLVATVGAAPERPTTLTSGTTVVSAERAVRVLADGSGEDMLAEARATGWEIERAMAGPGGATTYLLRWPGSASEGLEGVVEEPAGD